MWPSDLSGEPRGEEPGPLGMFSGPPHCPTGESGRGRRIHGPYMFYPAMVSKDVRHVLPISRRFQRPSHWPVGGIKTVWRSCLYFVSPLFV